MLGWFTILLVCQLVGEVVTRLAHWPVPGPVLGMAILFVGLVIRGRFTGDHQPPVQLEATASAILRNLSLLFVPAGAGVMLHLALLQREWLPISVSLVVSTALTIAVTALVMQILRRKS